MAWQALIDWRVRCKSTAFQIFPTMTSGAALGKQVRRAWQSAGLDTIHKRWLDHGMFVTSPNASHHVPRSQSSFCTAERRFFALKQLLMAIPHAQRAIQLAILPALMPRLPDPALLRYIQG
jgi:hypothetical protein